MPRLSPRLIREAASVDSHLPFLLQYCRDLPSARNELRWLKEHANSLASTIPPQDRSPHEVTNLEDQKNKVGIPFRGPQWVKKTAESPLRLSSTSTNCQDGKRGYPTGDQISFTLKNKSSR